jgi:hypothetical protein
LRVRTTCIVDQSIPLRMTLKPASMKRDNASMKRRAESNCRHGGEDNDPILALMRYHNLPITRQDYLNLAYLGRPPKELSAEEEAELPKEVRGR